MAATPEAKVKAKIKKILKDNNVYFAMPIGTGYGSSGVPDFLCCVNGNFLAVEAKAGKGTTTALQDKNITRDKTSRWHSRCHCRRTTRISRTTYSTDETMNILTIDFETAYGGDLGFAKQTTEEYIRDPRFEVIGVAVQVNDGEPEWFSGTHQKLYSFLNKYDWKNSIALAHNAVFDGAILNWQFGITPKGWLDTLSMGRALHGTQVGGSLAVLAQHYGIGVKGEQVKQYINYFRKNFTEEELADYGVYCKNDVALTWDLYGHMSQGFPASELRLIDLTVRMFTEPVLQLDKDLLQAHLVAEQKRKAAILDRFDKDTLMSNPQFANMLVSFGVQPPMKKSPANGKQTFAFSKTDEEFKALLEHPDIGVQAVVAARLGTKSTIEETRTERFIGIAKRGPMPVPLRYYAAHTGRWGGDDKINLQNLQRVSPLKYAIVAPFGYVMIDSDSSQIEARMLAWLAGQGRFG
jgi:hypothetical protein